MTTPAAPHPASGLPLSTRARHLVRRVLRRAKYFTGDRPALLPLNIRLTPEGTTRRIDDDTAIVIEGFPRSGNTFAVFAFRQAQRSRVPVASHIHHLAPLLIAERRGLPLLVVVREPLDCLASYLVAGPHARPAGVLQEYIHHHRGILRVSQAAVIATFEQVTTDLGSVVDRINAQHGTDFDRFVHSEENERAVFSAIEDHHGRVHRRKEPSRVVPRPSADRRAEAAAWRAQLSLPAHADALAEARALHAELCVRAGQHVLRS